MESGDIVLICIPPITPTLSFIINTFDKSMLDDGSMFED